MTWWQVFLIAVCVLCAVLFRLIHLFTNLRKKHTAETVVPWLLLFGIFRAGYISSEFIYKQF